MFVESNQSEIFRSSLKIVKRLLLQFFPLTVTILAKRVMKWTEKNTFFYTFPPCVKISFMSTLTTLSVTSPATL